MKKSMKPKRAAQPATHPPVLDVKTDTPRGPASPAERDKPPRGKGAKGGR